MSIEELATLMDVSIEIHRRSDGVVGRVGEGARWYADLGGVEAKDGVCLRGTFGDGRNPIEALHSLASELSGKLLVRDAMTKECRLELRAPMNLTVDTTYREPQSTEPIMDAR